METRPHTLTPAPVCPLPIPREIEFLKKETAQRRVLEESELARKEEMDKLLDKVGPGVPWARPYGGSKPPWILEGERGSHHVPTTGKARAAPMPGAQA